jgi:hypothetical protein
MAAHQRRFSHAGQPKRAAHHCHQGGKVSLATHCDSIDMAYRMSSASYIGRWLVGAHRIFGTAAVLRAEGGGRGPRQIRAVAGRRASDLRYIGGLACGGHSSRQQPGGASGGGRSCGATRGGAERCGSDRVFYSPLPPAPCRPCRVRRS